MPQEQEPAHDAGTSKYEKQSRRPVIGVDLDECLGRFVPQLCLFHNATYGTNLTPEDFTSYYFHEVWGGSRSSADEKMNEFFDSPFFLDGIPIVEGAERVLRKHAASFDFHIVTSRQDALLEHTRRWVDANYPGLFTELHFGNHYAKDGVVQTSKPELCRAIEAVLIIDDNLRYATECAAAGIPAYLFGDYAWNRSPTLPESVKRAVSWAEVDTELEALLDTINGGGGSGTGDGASISTEQDASAAAAAAGAVVTAAVGGTAKTTMATAEHDDAGGAAAPPPPPPPPPNVAGKDAVTCAA